MQNELTQICEALDNLVQNQEARIYVSGQHALDESLSFGTTDAYLRTASALLRFLIAVQHGESIVIERGGITTHTSGSINDAFAPCSEVIIDSCALVQSEADARKLFEFFWDMEHKNNK